VAKADSKGPLGGETTLAVGCSRIFPYRTTETFKVWRARDFEEFSPDIDVTPVFQLLKDGIMLWRN